MKKKCVYQALSLSLSPPLEERARGEVRGGWPLVRFNHLGYHIRSTCNFHRTCHIRGIELLIYFFSPITDI